MDISPQAVKELRLRTGISFMQCKKALEETGGDLEQALQVLAKLSGDIAKKKFDRTLGAGVVQSYIHAKEIGALVLLSCETDFVAKNEEFIKLAYDIAMHAAAARPLYIRREDVPEEDIAMLREKFSGEVGDKPAEMHEKIIEGKLSARLKEVVLLEQSFIKDETKTIKDLLDAAVQKFGERTEVSKLSVFSVR
jgi:elongation factor Ts